MMTVACENEPLDLFSTDPVAPVLAEHNGILLTEDTPDEDVTFAWSAARNMAGEIDYTLYATAAADDTIPLGSTTDTHITMSKTELRTNLLQLPLSPNDNSSIAFFVEAADGTTTLRSESRSITCYIYGDAVPAVLSVSEAYKDSLVLKVDEMDQQIDLLTWSPARLGFKENIVYSLSAKVEEGEEYFFAEGLTACTYGKTVDEWNEIFAAAGCKEDILISTILKVYAKPEGSETKGIPSDSITVTVKTYLATYPDQMYLPGDYQSWSPATAPTIAQSSAQKGYYEGFVDMTASDEGFKFSPVPDWSGDFGSNNEIVAEDENGNTVVTATVGDGDNITVPTGFYLIQLDKRRNNLTMVKVTSMSLIGDATPDGWDNDTPITYDAESHTYSATLTLTQGNSYKFRLNNNWSYSIGNNGMFEGGENYTFDKETGEYKVILDVSRHPYSVNVLSTKYSENMYIPGAYCNWDIDKASYLPGNGEGRYEGFVNLVSSEGETCEWKFSPEKKWGKDFASEDFTYDSATGKGSGSTNGSGNITLPNGCYYIIVDMTNGSFTVERVAKVGLVGSATPAEWAPENSVEMTFDPDTEMWTTTLELKADQFKVCINNGWDINRGALSENEPYMLTDGKTETVVQNGKNLTVAEAGNYKITADLLHIPNTIKVEKQ